MAKNLYKSTFNYAGENYHMYTHSTSKEKAFLNFTTQLLKKLNVGKRTVMFAFDGRKDNYRIEEVRNGSDNSRRTHLNSPSS